MHKLVGIVCLFTVIAGCGSSGNSIEGSWQYDGGLYNGKLRQASPELVMKRVYAADSYEAFVTDAGVTSKYGAGTYQIEGDSVRITSTFSNTPSQTLNKTISYRFKVENDRLTINGTLPNGMVVEEYWKRVD